MGRCGGSWSGAREALAAELSVDLWRTTLADGAKSYQEATLAIQGEIKVALTTELELGSAAQRVARRVDNH